jgi:signal transduction histidine kinase
VSTSPNAPAAARERLIDYRLMLWGISAGFIALLSWGILTRADEISGAALTLLPWVALLAIVHLFPVKGWQSAHLVADWPIQVAAALLLPPVQLSLVGFIGAFDAREFRGQISFSKALFNRSQVGLNYFISSWVAHRIVASPETSSLILPLSFLILALAITVNYVLVGIEISLEHGYGFADVLPRLRLGTPSDFLLTFAGWGVLGAMLAALYVRVHPAALVPLVLPTLLTRQGLLRSQMLVDTSRAYQSREKALARLSHQIYEERSDERRLIASDLHDEVLQPLYKVTLMAHVLKADLASGRLLDIDSDLPDLLSATEVASATLRGLIGDLRRSTLGRAGLPAALERLIEGSKKVSAMRLNRRIDDVEVDPLRELVIYQIAKEGLSNALVHSHATEISVDLHQEPDAVVLTVKDNGLGFDVLLERESHYGLHIMRERATAAGGELFIDSAEGQGCSILLVLPNRNREDEEPTTEA